MSPTRRAGLRPIGLWSRHAPMRYSTTTLPTAFTRPEIAWWMLDFAGPGLQQRLNKRTRGMLDSAPLKFAPANGVAYFEDLGWRAIEVESVFTAARRFDRLPRWMRPVAWLRQLDPRRPGNN